MKGLGRPGESGRKAFIRLLESSVDRVTGFITLTYEEVQARLPVPARPRCRTTVITVGPVFALPSQFAFTNRGAVTAPR